MDDRRLNGGVIYLVGAVKSTLGNLRDQGGVGERESLKICSVLVRQSGRASVSDRDFIKRGIRDTYRSRHIGAGDTLNRRIEVVESITFNYLCANLTSNTEHGEATLDNQESVDTVLSAVEFREQLLLSLDSPVGLLHTLDDGINIQRPDTPQVNHFRFDALLLQLSGGVQGPRHHDGVSDDGHVTTLLLNLRFANGQDEVFGLGFSRHGERDTVQHLVLEEDDRVRVSDGCLQRLGERKIRNIYSQVAVANNHTLRRPLQSSALQGLTTFRPGIEPYHAA